MGMAPKRADFTYQIPKGKKLQKVKFTMAVPEDYKVRGYEIQWTYGRKQPYTVWERREVVYFAYSEEEAQDWIRDEVNGRHEDSIN